MPDIITPGHITAEASTIATNELALPRATKSAPAGAHIRARIGGYAVDMVIFGAIAMLVTVLAGLILLLGIDWGTEDPTDAQLYTFLAIIGIGLPIIWTALNIALLATRGQTGGQYVAGLRASRDDDSRISARDGALWWLCFNPLLFSWPMAAVIAGPASGFIIIGLVRITIVVWSMSLLLCIAAPIIALVSASIDKQNRALHDRVVGVIIRPVE